MAVKKFATQENMQALVNELKNRVVHQEEGKGLSTNDLTAELLAKINAAQSAEQVTTAIAEAVAGADHLQRKIVETKEEIDLEAANADRYIYLVKNGETYDEYMVVGSKLEKVGDWAMDLTGYIREEDLQELSSEDIAGLFTDWNG